MKTIYESILSSTNSGKEKIVSGLKDWVVENLNYTGGNLFKANKLYGIDVKVKNGGYSINVNTGWDSDWFRFDSWVKDTEKYVHSVKDIKINNKAVNVYYAGINFSKTDSFVDTVSERLVLSGGEFEIINKLPKNCRKIFFDWRHQIGGGKPVRVKQICDIAVDDFNVSQHSSGYSTLSCMLSNIKNITVRNKMLITDGMLGYSALEKGARMFTEETSAMLDEFFKDNNVDPSVVVFLPNPQQSKKNLRIYYNKDKERWCTRLL